ncbi:IclR family transcriptional regulator [Peribacillus muralis]|uniref:IclR family transcriptional regulator n=1 Tax=Peribacillus muralis TaxID=264697 RepID=UPI000710CD0A|nr:IclR family transcriptional regulator [Peribacillus muralis]
MSTQDKSIIQSIEKIPQILDLFIQHTSLTLHDIHLYSGFTKTSASRMCNSLVNIGYLEKIYIGQTPYYRLGIELYRLGKHAIESLDIQSCAKKYLNWISKELGGISYLFIERNDKALCLDTVKGIQYIQTNSTNVGDLLPFNKGGGPLAMLSHYDLQTQNTIIENLNLSHDEESLLRQKINAFKTKGYAISLEEFSLGTGALGVPIYDVSNTVVGALSVGGIIDHFSEGKVEQIEHTLKKYSLDLSKELGFSIN